MANPEVAYFQIHPNRSKVAFRQLIAAWSGILVSDGYLVSQRLSGNKAFITEGLRSYT
jgi:transposase